jgi:predicted RNase H-like HicB family nuclease
LELFSIYTGKQVGSGDLIYPAYVHLGDEKHAHGVTLPDFVGCFTAADEYVDLPAQVQQAVELHFEGEAFDIPEASSIDQLQATGDYEGGVWMLIDIDMSKLDARPKRLNVSIPAYVVSQMDQYAAQNHLTRSALIVKATQHYLESQHG